MVSNCDISHSSKTRYNQLLEWDSSKTRYNQLLEWETVDMVNGLNNFSHQFVPTEKRWQGWLLKDLSLGSQAVIDPIVRKINE